MTQVLYSDYATCMIKTSPSHCPGCFMWAMNDASQEDVITCLEKLEYFCGTGIIETYNETRCAVVQDG